MPSSCGQLCNFKPIIKWASNNSKLNTDIDFINLLMHDSNLKELNIVITYDSFVSDKFLNVFKNKLKYKALKIVFSSY